MKIVAISDTHSLHDSITSKLPEANILICAGDITNNGSLSDLCKFDKWLGEIKDRYDKILVISGNHDRILEKDPKSKKFLTNCIYLQDELFEWKGIRIYGSPWTPVFYNFSFMKQRGPEIRKVWDLIPEDLDILITHGPPIGILDHVPRGHVGCEQLKEVVEIKKPRYNIFGHIHEGYGQIEKDGTIYINASICNEYYNPINPVVEVSI